MSGLIGIQKNTISNGANNTLDNLSEGKFILNVTDKNPNSTCTLTRFYEIPEALLVEDWFDLIPELVCLKEQKNIPEAKIPNQGEASYSWILNGKEVSSVAEYSIPTSGNYILKVIDESGCNWEKNIDVKFSQFIEGAEFLLPSFTDLNKEVTIVNTSDIILDGGSVSFDNFGDVYWNVYDSYGVTINDDQIVESTNQFITLTFDRSGTYTVELIVGTEACSETFKKTIIVSDKIGETASQLSYSQPLIISFKATPNPTKENYNVTFELSRQSLVYMSLSNELGNNIFTEYLGNIEKDWTKTYESLNLQSGIYFLMLITPTENATIKIIKQ
jgi:hypothetical protein